MRTGYYLRVLRDGKAQSLDIAELSDDELLTVCKNWDEPRLKSWLLSLKNFIKEIRPIEQQLDTPSTEPKIVPRVAMSTDLVHSEEFVIMLLGYITSRVPELLRYEPPKLLDIYEEFKKEVAGPLRL